MYVCRYYNRSGAKVCMTQRSWLKNSHLCNLCDVFLPLLLILLLFYSSYIHTYAGMYCDMQCVYVFTLLSCFCYFFYGFDFIHFWKWKLFIWLHCVLAFYILFSRWLSSQLQQLLISFPVHIVLLWFECKF